MKPIIVIGAWINTFEKEKELIDLCARLKSKFDICVSSHYPIPQSVQNECRFTVYDSNNELISKSLLPKGEFSAWIDNPNIFCRFRAEAIYSLYTYAVLLLIKNPLQLASLYGYDTFIYLEADFIIHDKDIWVIDKYLTNMFAANKLCYFNNFNEDFVSTGFFISNIDYFLNSISHFSTGDEYAKECLKIQDSILLENYFYRIFMNNSALITKIKNTQDIFPNSIIDKYTNNSADKNPIMFDIVNDIKNTESLFFVAFNLYHEKDQNYFARITSDVETIDFPLSSYFVWRSVSGKIFNIEILHKEKNFYKQKCLKLEDIKSSHYYVDFK